MDQTRDDMGVDRRRLLLGGATLVGGAGLVGAAVANASPDDPGPDDPGEATDTIPAEIAARVSPDTVEAIPLLASRRVTIEAVPGATVKGNDSGRLGDFAVGEGIMVLNADRGADGTVAAQRVVRAVFGVRSDG